GGDWRAESGGGCRPRAHGAAAAPPATAVRPGPAANSGCSAALTRAVLTCSCWATAAVIASWPCRSSADLEPTALEPPGSSLADMAFARAPGLAPVDATAAALPAARAAVTAAAAAIILVRLRMRTLLGLWLAPREPSGTQAGRRSSLPRPKKATTYGYLRSDRADQQSRIQVGSDTAIAQLDR